MESVSGWLQMILNAIGTAHPVMLFLAWHCFRWWAFPRVFSGLPLVCGWARCRHLHFAQWRFW